MKTIQFQIRSVTVRLIVTLFLISLVAGCTNENSSGSTPLDAGTYDSGEEHDSGSGDAADSGDSEVEPECSSDEDCDSGVCDTDTGMCAEASCEDSVQNGDETDVDCGGSCAAKCGDGEACEASSDCTENATCDSSTSACTCDEGFAVGDDGTCVDVDECADGSAGCDANATCTNTEGGFECACDGPDFVGDGFTCYPSTDCENGDAVCDSNASCVDDGDGNSICECMPGYSGDGVSCSDTDECDQGTDDCDALTDCTNTDGGYTCSSCPTGYDDVNGDGTSCVDINECSDGTDNCDALTGCTNTDGGYTCSSCPTGYDDVNGDGTSCVPYESCAQILANSNSPTTGDYEIDTGTGGPITVHCDFDTDGGVGYTMYRIDDSSLTTNQDDYRAACAGVGMELIVPRTRSHALAIEAWNGEKPALVGVYPKTTGATGLENWEGECEGVRGCRFWLSDTNNTDCTGFEPNGDNNVDDALYLEGTGCDWGRWNDMNNALNLNQGAVVCSTNDVGPAESTSCADALSTDSVYNTEETGGISGTYSIDTGTGGPIAAHCDFDIDGGVGYTMYRIDDTSLTTNQDDYRAACAGVGMELIVPRTRSHALAIEAWNGEKPALVGVYPKTNGATGLENWEGECEGVRGCRFWLSDSNDSGCSQFEPNGDNNVDDALYLDDTGCDWGRWNDMNNALNLNQGAVVCSPNDVGPAASTSCVDALGTDSVYNTEETGGIDGTYSIDPEQDGTSMSLTCDMTGGGWTQISSEDFEGSVSGWSDSRTSSACYGTTMLGGYNNFGTGASTSKTFSLLNVPHTEVETSLTAYIIDSWDNENFNVYLDGATVFTNSYSATSATTNVCGQHWADIGAVPVSETIFHTVDDLTLGVSSTLNSTPDDESWGVDDVGIWVR